MKLHLFRDNDTGKETLGRLYAEGDFLCFTLENTYLNNAFRISCIPTGTYPLTTKTYGRFYERFKKPIPILQNTAPRSEILIHPGNYAKDTLGCILVGDRKTETAVLNSRVTWNKIHSILSAATEITITDV